MADPVGNLPWTAALRERFGFETPTAFRRLESRDLFTWRNERWEEMERPGNHYLWFADMEWIPPADLRSFSFEDYHLGGFVPFAHSGGGDYWCWHPSLQQGDSIPVVFCAHDSELADLYAPDFAAALCRHAIEFTTDPAWEQDRAMRDRWIRDLGAHWPARWRDHVASLEGVTTWDDHLAWVGAELGPEYVRPFGIRWMKP